MQVVQSESEGEKEKRIIGHSVKRPRRDGWHAKVGLVGTGKTKKRREKEHKNQMAVHISLPI
jgi:CDGSH-type Zn-finger protein